MNKILSLVAVSALALTSVGCKVSGTWEKLTNDSVVFKGTDGKTVEVANGKGSVDLSAYGLESAMLDDTKIKVNCNCKKTQIVLPDSYKGKYLSGLKVPAADLGQDFDMSVSIGSETYDLGADVCQSCYRPAGCSITSDDCQVCEDYACRNYRTDSQAYVTLEREGQTVAKFTSKVQTRYHSSRIH